MMLLPYGYVKEPGEDASVSPDVYVFNFSTGGWVLKSQAFLS